MCFTKFKKADEKFLCNLKRELKENRTKSKSIFLRSIIQYKSVHWYVKTKDEKAKYKEILASKIACQMGLNAVEIIEINEDDIESIKNIIELENGVNYKNTYLVRTAQSYTKNSLPIKDLNEAAASELIFSLWIRRRDTHSDNRGIIDDIPIFFDFHAAFDRKDCSKFFNNGQKNGEYKNWGYAGCWRIKEGKYTTETRKEIKEAKNSNICYHLIENYNKFEAQLNMYCRKIEQYDIEKLFNEDEVKNFDDTLSIKQLLIETKKTIQEDCKALKDILKNNLKL